MRQRRVKHRSGRAWEADSWSRRQGSQRADGWMDGRLDGLTVEGVDGWMRPEVEGRSWLG